jgi:Lipid A 3-O-deacylase (PagL)
VICARGARAQVIDTRADPGADHRERQSVWTVWTASAHRQPLATRLGYRYDRGLVLVGVQKRWPLAESLTGALELAYTIDLLPVVLSTEMPEYTTRDVSCGAGAQRGCVTQVSVLSGQHTAYGAGAAPIGFVARWRMSPAVGLQLRASGGMLYFSQVIPDPLGCQLNFTADAGLAADIQVAKRLALVAGWRLNHISNGGRGKVNPGMNSRMIELGLSLAR